MEIRHLFSWLSNCSSCTKMFPGEVTCVTRTLMSLRQVGRLRLGFSSSEAGGGVGTIDRTSSSNGGSQTVVSKGWVSLTWFLMKQQKMNIEKEWILQFSLNEWVRGRRKKDRKKEWKTKKDGRDVPLVFLRLTVYWKQQGHFWPVCLQYWLQENRHRSHTDTRAQV